MNRKEQEPEGGQKRTRGKEEWLEMYSVYCTESQGIYMCSLFVGGDKE